MKKRWMVGGLVVASLVWGAGPAMAGRDRLEDRGMGWEWAGGTATAAGVSVDGPKSSNAYQLNGTNGSYVYLRGYWDMPLDQFSASFAYKVDAEIADSDGSPRISIEMAPGVANGGDVIWLDPYYCPSAANAKGWATTDFFRTGSSCTLFLNGQPYTGTDTTSAWSAILAEVGTDQVWISYLIADWEGTSMVDRVRFGGSVLSHFGADTHPVP